MSPAQHLPVPSRQAFLVWGLGFPGSGQWPELPVCLLAWRALAGTELTWQQWAGPGSWCFPVSREQRLVEEMFQFCWASRSRPGPRCVGVLMSV